MKGGNCMPFSPYFDDETRFTMCDDCGRRMRRVKDIFGNWDGETYRCPYCNGGEDYDDDDE